MSWFNDVGTKQKSWYHRLACQVLKAGPLPKHIAFIMDGNRRFARRRCLDSVLEGHSRGFDTLTQVLEWCRDLDIREVTVYAFSIENFQRSSKEVDGLMDLSRQKFTQLLNEKGKIARYGVRFRFFGNLSLLPADLQALIKEVAEYSKDFDRSCLNVCLSYTSRDEMHRAIVTLAEAAKEGVIEPSDVTEELISLTLDTRGSPDPDLLIRTSGEYRLSDFLLWQCSYSCCCFEEVLWPEFAFRHLFYAILHYQKNFTDIQAIKKASRSVTTNTCDDKKKEAYVSWLSARS